VGAGVVLRFTPASAQARQMSKRIASRESLSTFVSDFERNLDGDVAGAIRFENHLGKRAKSRKRFGRWHPFRNFARSRRRLAPPGPAAALPVGRPGTFAGWSSPTGPGCGTAGGQSGPQGVPRRGPGRRLRSALTSAEGSRVAASFSPPSRRRARREAIANFAPPTPPPLPGATTRRRPIGGGEPACPPGTTPPTPVR
jgi:hypothetical protein